MRQPVRIAAVALISSMLIVGSFVVGNFGLSEGFTLVPSSESNVTICFPMSEPDYTLTNWVVLERLPYYSEVSGLIRDYHAGVLWLSLFIALFLFWLNRANKKQQIQVESFSPPVFNRLKHPPAPPQPKRHHKYRPA